MNSVIPVVQIAVQVLTLGIVVKMVGKFVSAGLPAPKYRLQQGGEKPRDPLHDLHTSCLFFESIPGNLAIDITRDLSEGLLAMYSQGSQGFSSYKEAVRRTISRISEHYKVPSPTVYFYDSEKDLIPSYLLSYIDKKFGAEEMVLRERSVSGEEIRVPSIGGVTLVPEMLSEVLVGPGVIVFKDSAMFVEPWSYLELPLHEAFHHVYLRNPYRFELYQAAEKADPMEAMRIMEKAANDFVRAVEEVTGGRHHREYILLGDFPDSQKLREFEEWWEENTPV